MTFEITPVTTSTASAPSATPQFLQFQSDGTNVGDADVIVVNFTGPGVEATRGTGENANVITVRITPPPVNFFDNFNGFAEALYLHTPDVAPSGFTWVDNSPSTNLQLDGAGGLENPTSVFVTGVGAIIMPMSTSYLVGFEATMDGAGSTDSISGVSLSLTDFNTGYSLTMQLERVFGGTYNLNLLGGISGTALDIGAGGFHAFVATVTPTGCDITMDGNSILTATGSANLVTVNQIEVSITNTDAGRNHVINSVEVDQL